MSNGPRSANFEPLGDIDKLFAGRENGAGTGSPPAPISRLPPALWPTPAAGESSKKPEPAPSRGVPAVDSC